MKIEQEKDVFDLDLIVKKIQSVVQQEKKPIALHEPHFGGNEWLYVKECLDSGWVSSVGKYVDLFEEKLAEFTGVRKAVAVVNGTAALQICLQLVGVEHEDEVLIPALTFIATANAVTYCGAVPHLVDSEERTLGLDAFKLRSYLKEIGEVRNNTCYNKITKRRIKAVVAMHTFGHPVDLDELVAVCEDFYIELVEDAAESLGSYYKGRHTGNWGKVSAVSFNGNKVITTGGGGAILTNDIELGKLAKHLTTQAKVPHKWEFNHDMIGYNYRMPNINAALGCAQLEQLSNFVVQKRNLTELYKQAFSEITGVSFFTEQPFAKSNYWLNVILLDENFKEKQKLLLTELHNAGVLARPAWILMHKLPMYKNCPRMDLRVADGLEQRIINLPSSVGLV